MQEVKFSDLDETRKKLLNWQEKIFGKISRVELQKVLNIKPDEKLGINFCGNANVREQLKRTFNELCQKLRWYTKRSNIVLTRGKLKDLNATIKNIKQLKVIIVFSTYNKKLKTDFANTFLKYIVDVLRYEKHKKAVQIDVSDTSIEKPNSAFLTADYASIPQEYLNFGESSWTPTIKDIKQGYVGDCYLLAALLHLISKDPHAIKKCFVNRATIKSDKYVKIRFFKVNLVEEHIYPNQPKIVAKPKDQVIIKVDKTVLLKKDLSTGKPKGFVTNQVMSGLWVTFIEKAFMVYKSNDFVGTKFTENEGIQNILEKWNNKKGPITVKNLSGGLGFIAYTAITGKRSSMNYLPKTTGKKFPINSAYEPEAERIYKLFDTEIKNGKIIAVSTKNEYFEREIEKVKSTTIWTDKSGNPKKYAGLIGKHAYAIVENVEEGEGPARNIEGKFDGTCLGNFKFIVLQNPHANQGFEKYKFDEDNKKLKRIEIPNTGKLRIELNDFLKYFRCYDIIEN